MRNLKLLEMLLVSHKEKRAKKIVFHPEATVFKGKNDTGKSSLIKSIYYTFGATPSNIHPNWKEANVSTFVRFDIDGTKYGIFRLGKSFSLFTGNDKLIGTYNRITTELAPKLAEILNFKLSLVDRVGNPSIPTPSYLFLPFYIDQDSGWTKILHSFDDLGQFPKWKTPVIDYHTGKYPNHWYELTAEKIVETTKREAPLQRERALNELIKRMEKKLSIAHFDIDVKTYKKEIDTLLVKCENLKKKEEDYKDKLIRFESDRIRLQAQKDIVTYARNELDADYVYASNIDEDHIDCPTCGETYSNSFSERFSIALDQDRCCNLLQRIQKDLRELEERIALHRNELKEATEELEDVDNLLSTKQGNLTLKDLIQNEGKKEVTATLYSELTEVQDEISLIESVLRGIESELDKYRDKMRSKEINLEYGKLLRRYTAILNVNTLPESAFKNAYASIRDTGSDQPRAILAYYFTMLGVIRLFGSAIFCPIILDAINQQEQDNTNYKNMLELIRDQRPEGSQLILGLVDDCGINFGGKVIELTDQYNVLSKKDYRSVSEEMEPYSNVNLGI